MPSRTSKVLIAHAQGDPFIHSFLAKKVIGFGKKFIGKLINPGTKTKAVITAAAGGAVGTALVGAGGRQMTQPGLPAQLAEGAVKAGLRFVFDPLTGQHVPMKKRRRRRGITATELSGFRKVNRLLASVGMTPRKPRKRS